MLQLDPQHSGDLYQKLPDGKVLCTACGHRCKIADGRFGICRIRQNRGGILYVPKGYVGALQLDPIEKKPFFHAYPGAKAMSFGMLGCDFHCAYCQNWITSQAFRDPEATGPAKRLTAKEIVKMAQNYGADIITSTYNEPLITSEWAVEIFKMAKASKLVTSYVSNGNATPEVLDYIKPWVDLYKVDLKGFNDRNYRKLGGVLENILKSIRLIYEKGFWLEIVTLVIPGFNDSDDELKGLSGFLASVSPLIPWHVTAFHKDYKMTDPENTSADTLLRAAAIGTSEGLKYVYAGNLPGGVGKWENTYCHACGEMVIERVGFHVVQNKLKDNRCPKCLVIIPGRFSKE